MGALTLGWMALCVAAYWGTKSVGDARARAALQRLRDSGAAVLPEDLAAAPQRQGTPATVWIARFEALEQDKARAARVGFQGFDGMGLSTSVFAPGPGRVYYGDDSELDVALREAPETKELSELCAGQVLRFFWAIDHALDDPAVASERRDALLFTLRWIGAHDQAALDFARTACAAAPAGIEELLELPREGMPWLPHYPFDALDGVTVQLAALARLQALNGDGSECARTLEALFCASALTADLPWQVAYEHGAQLQVRALHTLGQCVAYLPDGVDMSRIVAALDGLDPQGRYVRALEGECAFANQMFLDHAHDDVAFVADGESPGLFAQWLANATRGFDHAAYLEITEHAVAIARAAPREARTLGAAYTAAQPPWTVFATWFAPHIGAEYPSWVAVEARLRLCKLALIARSAGFADAQQACATLLDPFTNAAMHSRIDADGALTLWSVGSDGLDSAAPRIGSGITMGTTSIDDLAIVLPAR